MENALYWFWLSLKLGPGNSQFVGLLEHFLTPRSIYEATEEELLTFKKEFGEATVERLFDKNLDEAYSLEEYCVRKRVKILHYGAKDYPKQLTNLKNPPIILYARGRTDALAGKLCIGVVGAREMTDYGRDAAYRMGYELAAAGAVVVSGLALGVDSAAACGALDAGGLTVAVLGSGLDRVYPAEHKRIAAEIEERGILLSEYPPTAGPTRASFPIRNRIISGLSQGTLVVEATARSGALHTARDAVLQGRDLFALPGNVDSVTADGTNALIRDGAGAVTCAQDILENYAYLYRDAIDPTAARRVSVCSRFAPGKLLAHGVAETSRAARAKEKRDDRLSQALHFKKRIDGKTVREMSGETEYPVYDAKGPKATSAAPVAEMPKHEPDRSKEALGSLPADCQEVFEAMPIGRPISADELCRAGFDISQLMIAFTMLEMNGLITALPGGLYCRR
ncbi:MAG: DNA-protecting protein DprA [Ruminococcaceae bacterium]|nr:DNA-protecting protein DprA [Oscillospiraceae bacterium]